MNVFRRTTWLLGAPFRQLLLAAIGLYRATLSGWLGGQCRFYPSCSSYAEDAVRAHGAVKGSSLAAWRLLRCNPFGQGGIDHVPVRGARPACPPSYDAVIQQAGARS